MPKGYLSNRQKNLKIGISSYTENSTVLEVTGKVGIGTTNATTRLQVQGVLGFGAGNNIKIGDNTTGANLTSGHDNIFMGIGAGNSNTNGAYNNFFGRNSGYFNTGGSYNNFFGLDAGCNNTTGSFNTIIGSNRTSPPILNGSNQLVIGAGNTDWIIGNSSYFVGIGTTNPTSKLTVFGDTIVTGVVTASSFSGNASSATYATTAGIATYATTSGVSTSVIGGIGSITSLTVSGITTTGTLRVGTGGTIITTTGIGSIGIGTTNPTTRLHLQGVLGFGADNNIKIGDNTTGCSITSGSDNFFAGVGAGRNNTTGKHNNFFGRCAGSSNTTGKYNNFFGRQAGFANTTGNVNNFFGFYAGRNNTSGGYNNFFGFRSGCSNTIGRNNNFFGQGAGRYNTTGNVNNFIGYYAGRNNISGNCNIFFGFNAGCNNTTGSFNVVIGANRTSTPILNGDNQLVIGSGSNDWIIGNSSYNIGIGTTNPTSKLTVFGDTIVTGVVTASSFSGNASSATYATTAGIATYATTAGVATALQNARTFQITGDIVASQISFNGTGNVSLAATIQPNSVALGTDTTGDYVQSITGTTNQITVTNGTGEGSTPTLSIPNQFTIPQDATISRDLLVTRNLNVNGNITIGGTSASLFTTEFRVFDPDIVLGFRTDVNGNDSSTDNTANHGGIAIASTEGTPLVQLFDVGIGETNPATYKKFMWFKSGSFNGLGTDAWLSNYAIGIGSTQFPLGTRLAAGAVQFTQNDLAVVRNINASGIITASSFIGNASSASYATTSGISTYATSSGIATYATTSGVSTNVIGGIGSITQLRVTGISTFVNGPVLVGAATSTGTASQPLQVTGGAYVSGTLGIGITNPSGNLHIASNAPTITFTDNNSSPNEKTWFQVVNGTDFYWQALTDAGAGGGNLFKFTRSAENIQTFEGLNSGISWFKIDNNLTRVGIGTSIPSAVLDVRGTPWFRPNETGTKATALRLGKFSDNSIAAYDIITDDFIGDDLEIQSNRFISNVKISRSSPTGIQTTFLINTHYQSGSSISIADTTGSIVKIKIDEAGNTYFNNSGAVLVGSISSTGTASQSLQVTGGAYVSGNVGIGTTTPLQKIHVLGNLLVAAGSSTGQHITQKAYELNNGTLSWEGSAGQLFSITNNLTTGSIFSVNDVSGIPSIDVDASGSIQLGAYSGNVGVGTTNPTAKLSVVGNVNVVGVLTATDLNSSSDISLKENIKIIENPIETVMKLDGVSFDWKETGKSSFGVIAQQIEEFLPQLVSGNNPKSVNYNGLVGLLIEVVKEQQRQIDELKNKLQ